MSNSFAYCPFCKTWTPYELMHYDYDPDTGTHIRVCDYCLNGLPNPGIHDPDYGKVECPWCESTNTKFKTYLDPRGALYHCNDCGEDFPCGI